MTAVAKALFAALVVATIGAFFAAQQLKSSPPLVQQVGVFPWLSPNQDGRYERSGISFQLKRGDTVDVQIVDREGDQVDELPSRRLDAGEQYQERWDGRDENGAPLPDGTYRARVVLRGQGRTVTLQKNIRLDTAPPEPRVLSIGPQESNVPRPELLPNPEGGPAEIRFSAPGRRSSVEIWRTDLDRPRLVTGLEIATQMRDEQLPNGIGETTWDGTRKDGSRAPQGTYVAVVRVRDQAGNIGQSVPDSVLRGDAPPGQRMRGRGGITVRYLGAQPPMVPTGAGREFSVGVDARGATYNWELRKVGEPGRRLASRRSAGGDLKRRAPRGASGLYLFEARTRDRSVSVPVPVDDRRNNRVLVILPATTWQGRNEVDDDGDGLANTLVGRYPTRINRVFTELPPQILENEGPLLAWLQRQGRNYDLTTDVALGQNVGPQLKGHRGVLVAGDATWLTEDVRRSLRSFAAGGGTVASFGTRSLRGEVRQTQRRFLSARGPSDTDIFGARILPIQRRTVNLVSLEDDPKLQLFAGEEGLFPNVEAWEATRSTGTEAKLASSAVTEEDNRPVIVAARFGDGVVIRTGIPGFATRLSGDEASAELFGRIWTLLRTG